MKRTSILIAFLALGWGFVLAQTPVDGFMMKPGQICIALGYEHESWSKYWENTLLRDNGNIGTFRAQSSQNMVALGLTNRLNVIAALPFISTSSSAGTMAGHSGLQDASLWLKFSPFSKKWGETKLTTFLSAGISTPASDYYPDLLPFSIGLGSTNGIGNVVAHLETKHGWYATVHGGYAYRSNITIDRDYYDTDTEGSFYTNEVFMPNVADAAVMLGWMRNTLRLEATYSMMNTLGGSNMRRQDMPFPGNDMDASRVSAMFQYRLPKHQLWGFTGNAGYTLTGKNMGRTLSVGGGVLLQFYGWKKKPDAK